MRRDLYSRLQDWKHSKRRKPLLLQGARQTGKTFLLHELGRSDYDGLVYCNFEADPMLPSLFDRDLDPARIVADLRVYFGREIRPARDLIVFDEIQISQRALASLKYFQEEAPEYHVAAAGSLLGVKMSGPASFPVGKVNFLQLHPMTFLEFLDAMGADRYRARIEAAEPAEAFPAAFHAELTNLLRKYYAVGGMPEAVHHFSSAENPETVREIHSEILDSYVLDFAKHAPGVDVPKLSLVWDSVPQYLARENKKFVFAALRTGARAREYESALRWLVNAGLIHFCTAVEAARRPLDGRRPATLDARRRSLLQRIRGGLRRELRGAGTHGRRYRRAVLLA